jgi:hypothetical protein
MLTLLPILRFALIYVNVIIHTDAFMSNIKLKFAMHWIN